MKYFHKMVEGLDVSAVMHQLARNPDLWDENTLRTKHPGTAHANVSDIWLMFNYIPSCQGELKFDEAKTVIDDREIIPYRAWDKLTALKPIIFALMRQVEGVRLGRVIITKLPVGKTITPHVDQGAPATYFDRYQIALQCEPGNIFKIGDEEVSFKTGDIWLINNKVEHSVINNSATDRIVCIADIRSE